MRQRQVPLLCTFIVAVLLPAIAPAAPFTIAYTFTGSPGSQASEPVDANPAGATFSDITRGPGILAVAGANSINSDDWTTGAGIDLTDYYEFTIVPDPGFVMDLTNLTFTYGRSDSGPTQVAIRSSLNGFATTFAGVDNLNDTANHRTSFGLFGFTDLQSAISFRIYGFAAGAAAGTMRLGIAGDSALTNNLEVSGEVSQVPEPTSLLLLGVAVSALRLRRPRA